MKILAMDTTTLVMGVAVLEENKVLGEVTTNLLKNHSVRLMPTIDRLLKDLDLKMTDMDVIAVTSGPGSYTGIRIGVTSAKTMAWARKIPLYSESSLTVLAMNGFRFPGLVVPIFDARRQRVYSGVYRTCGNKMEEVMKQQVVSIHEWLEQIAKREEPVLFLGDDVQSFRELIIQHLNERAVFGDPAENIPRPSQLGWLIWQKIIQGEKPESQAFTPNYLQLTQAEANWLQKQGNGESVHESQGRENCISSDGSV
ncbi:tRNA (adenosine(37)-N6)-threonylcarbamoyltransferase complex dimerization subunit type 1 TsaB [Thermoflavimicrobium dichotomicum]|uniref:tRNA threonylcarbamoyladenosine biosynthesis protein TsaB n=1 Tax=Thermoflavimicrobium dichotomicum TaxID=46223 RepID=A0A1I3TP56_9BACL|nr:tRNA (adenosine(37)-N6)-threonylcarbamoyltransferase complex dimerization subunit type 1 TsaB [Thermoflavimicrobium dichotomicum]SFJ73054.1 tRNA threonylcarbamoyladenosine biosynthesis protein TsaB [Thermoflavimicrobium dichotomicum]